MFYQWTLKAFTEYTESSDAILAYYLWHVGRRVFNEEPKAIAGFHRDTFEYLDTVAAVGDIVSSLNHRKE